MFCIVAYDSDGDICMVTMSVFFEKEKAEKALLDRGYKKSLIGDYWCKNCTETQYVAYIEEIPYRGKY